MKKKHWFKQVFLILTVLLFANAFLPLVHANNNRIFRVGLTLDCARMYNSPDTIERYIDMIQQQHGTYLQLHLTDDESFGIENTFLKQTPKQNSYQKGDVYYSKATHQPYLTKAQLKAIIDYGTAHQVQIVPEFELPSHATALIQTIEHNRSKKQAKQLVNPFNKKAELNYHSPKVIKFSKQLLAEYIPLLPKNSYVATGGDEVTISDESDDKAIVKFDNQLNRYLNQNGLNMQIWNDSVMKRTLNQYDKNILVNYWSQSGVTGSVKTNTYNIEHRASLPEINNVGMQTINSNEYFLYLIADNNETDPNFSTDFTNELNEWYPSIWNENDLDDANTSDKNIGVSMSIWGQDATNINDTNRVLNQVQPFYQTYTNRLKALNFIA